MINKENLQHFKNVAESLAKEIAEFENQNAAPVDDWPMSIDDLPKRKCFSFINEFGDVQNRDSHSECAHVNGQYDSEKDAKSAYAFSILSRLIRHVNKGWEPNFENRERKYTVRLNADTGGMYADFQYLHDAPKCIFFKNKEDAERSIETWRQLWLDYFQVDEQ